MLFTVTFCGVTRISPVTFSIRYGITTGKTASSRGRIFTS